MNNALKGTGWEMQGISSFPLELMESSAEDFLSGWP